MSRCRLIHNAASIKSTSGTVKTPSQTLGLPGQWTSHPDSSITGTLYEDQLSGHLNDGEAERRQDTFSNVVRSVFQTNNCDFIGRWLMNSMRVSGKPADERSGAFRDTASGIETLDGLNQVYGIYHGSPIEVDNSSGVDIDQWTK